MCQCDVTTRNKPLLGVEVGSSPRYVRYVHVLLWLHVGSDPDWSFQKVDLCLCFNRTNCSCGSPIPQTSCQSGVVTSCLDLWKPNMRRSWLEQINREVVLFWGFPARPGRTVRLQAELSSTPMCSLCELVPLGCFQLMLPLNCSFGIISDVSHCPPGPTPSASSPTAAAVWWVQEIFLWCQTDIIKNKTRGVERKIY